mgnify:CR=1 FL=1
MAKEKSLATQEIINIDRIEGGVIVLKNGSFRKILLVSGINFDLKSEEERNLIIFSYQEFLNSLSFDLISLILFMFLLLKSELFRTFGAISVFSIFWDFESNLKFGKRYYLKNVLLYLSIVENKLPKKDVDFLSKRLKIKNLTYQKLLDKIDVIYN